MKTLTMLLIVVAPVGLIAQSPSPLPAPVQIAAAVQPLPAQYRSDATVLGYHAGKAGLVSLRAGRNAYICLADDPTDDRFHVACYHNSLEPFMLRGRDLRAHGIANVDSARFAEIDAGKLKMPQSPAALFSLTARGKPDATGVTPGARPLYVLYVPFATAESTGLPTSAPAQGGPSQPWLMLAGTAKAHIMFSPTM
jgi:hypothetical protein